MREFLTLLNNPFFTALVSALAAWALTQITNRAAMKHHEKRQIIDRLLSERIKAYNALLAALSVFDEELGRVKHQANNGIPLEAFKASRKLHYVFLAYKVWISKETRDVYWELQENVDLTRETQTKKGVSRENNDLATIRIRSIETVARLVKAIEKDLGLDFLDQWISKQTPKLSPKK
jgi:hypothetical protein